MSDLADAWSYAMTSSMASTSTLTFKDLLRAVDEIKKPKITLIQTPRNYGRSLWMEQFNKTMAEWQAQYPSKFFKLELGEKDMLGNYNLKVTAREKKNMGCEPVLNKTPLVKALDRAKPEVAIIAELAREAGRGEAAREQLYETRDKLFHAERALEREVSEHTNTLNNLEQQRSVADRWYRNAVTAQGKLNAIAEKKRKETRAKKAGVKKAVAKKK